MADSKNAPKDESANAQGKDQQQATAADFEQTVREAEQEQPTLKPGQSQDGNSKQHNNGRGGGK